jgi:hypothetical protein
MQPLITPKEMIGGRKFPVPCSIAVICSCPLPEGLVGTPATEKYFELLSIQSVLFCRQRSEDIDYIVCFDVYGGPVVTSLVEEFHQYGVSSIIGMGFVGSLSEGLPLGTNVCVKKSFIDANPTHYPKCVTSDMCLRDLMKVTAWTTDHIYREYPDDLKRAASLKYEEETIECDVADMNCGYLFSVCKKLGMNCAYGATVGLDMTGLKILPSSIDESTEIKSSHMSLTNLVVGSLRDLKKFDSMKYATMLLEIINKTTDLFKQVEMCKSHDINHVLAVLDHTSKALDHESLPMKTKFLIEAAALLHDVDDRKFFATKYYSNARVILKEVGVCDEDAETVVEMISYVSTSDNWNNIPLRALCFPWLLFPRHADRLEGADPVRGYQYSKEVGQPLFTQYTSKPSSSKLCNILKIATESRFQEYKGKSISFVDHLWDKLFSIINFETNNPYFLEKKKDLFTPLAKIVDLFINNKLTDEYFETLVQTESQNEHPIKGVTSHTDTEIMPKNLIHEKY